MNNGNGNGGNGTGVGRLSGWTSAFLRRYRRREAALAPFRRLAMQLHHDLAPPDSVRSTLVVTPSPSSLNAYGSVDLARCLAEELQRPVLLVDACPRAPELSNMLDCGHRQGFADCLSNLSMPVTDLIMCTSHANLMFLPAGKLPTAPRASIEEIRGFLNAAKQHYDFTVLCGGAVLTNPGSLAVAPAVGRVLLLAIENVTKIEDLDAARNALHFCKAERVGLVLTSLAR